MFCRTHEQLKLVKENVFVLTGLNSICCIYSGLSIYCPASGNYAVWDQTDWKWLKTMPARISSMRDMACLFIYLLTSAVNRNINIYKQEDGSGTLTQREPITLVTCYKTIKYTQNFTTYINLNIKQEYSIILFIRSREREHKISEFGKQNDGIVKQNKCENI